MRLESGLSVCTVCGWANTATEALKVLAHSSQQSAQVIMHTYPLKNFNFISADCFLRLFLDEGPLENLGPLESVRSPTS